MIKNNSGNGNSGGRNSGDWNSGGGNSGNWNSGGGNSGNWNSGDWNSGYGNSGNGNSGYWNSGNGNSGDWNSGYGNSGNWNSGFFNSNTPTTRLFNQDSNLEFDSDVLDKVRSLLYTKLKTVCVWISEEKMNDKEKSDHPSYKTTGGYLKQRDYKYCWKKSWENFNDEDKKIITSLPNFNSDIFEEITGIKVDEVEKKIKDDEIVVHGIKYKKVK